MEIEIWWLRNLKRSSIIHNEVKLWFPRLKWKSRNIKEHELIEREILLNLLRKWKAL